MSMELTGRPGGEPARSQDRLDLVTADGVHLDALLVNAARGPRGTVVLAHGINADLHEGGMYDRLAEALADAGFRSLRFSFRGHGRSGGTSRGATIAGEMLDLECAVEFVGRESGPLALVSASFGAVPTSLSLRWLNERLHGLVLWNPVLDLRATFLRPTLPWGRANFFPAALERLRRTGSLMLDGEFELGRTLFAEFECHEPSGQFATSDVPCLVVHGDQDSYVSYDIARDAARSRARCDFHTVVGSDHGFDTREREDEAITVTVDWLRTRNECP